jgi:hypothetical protein
MADNVLDGETASFILKFLCFCVRLLSDLRLFPGAKKELE